MVYDLVIRGGLVADGTGVEPATADIAIQSGRIAAVGIVTGKGVEEIDATGKLVTPGFVDIHTHYDGQAIWSERLNPSSSHGVTTVVTGNCGVGFAPCREQDHKLLVEVMEGVEDIPGVVMVEGLPWTWETFPEFLDALDARKRDIDVAVYLPHSPLRVYVMGDRGANREPATAEDLAKMRKLTREAMEAGALGVGSSRIFIHKTRDGRQIPSFDAAQSELRAIGAGLKDVNRGVFQMVLNPAVHGWERELDVLVDVVKSSGRPGTFSLTTNNFGPRIWQDAMAKVDAANAAGARVTAQVLPRPLGLIASFDQAIHPFCHLPSYQALAAMPFEKRIAELKKPEIRAKLISEELIKDGPPGEVTIFMMARYFDWMFPFGDPPNYEPSLETSVTAQARAKGVSPAEIAYDLMMQDEGRAKVVVLALNFYEGRLDEVYKLLKNPNVVIGLGDGGAHYGSVCDASYPTFCLTYWIRDRKGPRLSVAEVVHNMSQATAQAVGLLDRGVLKAGYKADINVIDLDRLALHEPEVKYDLPAGGRRIDQAATGYDATIVSGRIIRRADEPTGVLPGRVVRGVQPVPT